VGGLQDKDLVRRLRNGDRELLRHLRDDFGRAAEKAAGKAQRRILEASSKHPGPLRGEIAATVTARGRVTQSGLSAEIKSDGTLMPPGKSTLPAYADAEDPGFLYRRWRHPVYGNRKVWVGQTWPSARGWFHATIQDQAQSFSDAVQKAIDETTAYLEGRL
jgi:hypothetical protein